MNEAGVATDLNLSDASQDDADWAAAARQTLKSLDEVTNAQFGPTCDIEWMLRMRATRTDQVIRAAWSRCVPSSSPLNLFAVGGYGRQELFPQSDIDLTVFVAGGVEVGFDDASFIERFIALLWDAGLRAGHTVRNAAQTTHAAAEDITVMTALMDARPLAASDEAVEELRDAIAPALIWPGDEYYTAKLQELRTRHGRFGNTSDNLEPNIKEGPGGLRDLQTLTWIAKRVAGVASLEDLIEVGHSGADEIQTLLMQHVILARLRYGLALVASKREERLRFDVQRELATLLGYSGEGNQAVEEMMQLFYRSAALVRRIGERLLQRFEEQLRGVGEIEPIDDAFGLQSRYMVALDEEWPSSPEDVFALFIAWGRTEHVKGLHSQTARALAERLQSIPSFKDSSSRLHEMFLQIVRDPRAAKTLNRMARLGVLQRFLPAFRGVSGRMQFDLFHAYTVDQHTLAVLKNIEGFANQIEDARFSMANDVWPFIRRPELLVLAGLFHDIAKGRRGDHSELGAVDALEFCKAIGLSDNQASLVEWLVRYHLLMSTTAQKQDIEDPEVIRTFALKVGDRERLDYLYLLTVADIAATSPHVWNDWKDQVLAKTYTRTRLAMRRGLEEPTDAGENARETRAEVARLLGDDETVHAVMAKIPYALYMRASAEQIAWIARGMIEHDNEDMFVSARRLKEDSRDMEVFVYAQDAHGLFAAIVVSLDRIGLEIQQARVLDGTSSDIFDIFVVRPMDPRSDITPQDVEKRLTYALNGDWRNSKPTKRRQPSHLKHFRVATQVDVQLVEGSEPAVAVLTVVCNDRPGLLADLSQCLKEQGISVHDARIATFGERAEDIFRISGGVIRAPMDPNQLNALHDALIHCLDGAKK